MNFVERLGLPAVDFDGTSGTAIVAYAVDADHLICFLSGIAHLERDHGSFHIPDALPDDVTRMQGGEAA